MEKQNCDYCNQANTSKTQKMKPTLRLILIYFSVYILCSILINFCSFGIFSKFFRESATTNSPCDGDNWVAFKDEKCFKLIR